MSLMKTIVGMFVSPFLDKYYSIKIAKTKAEKEQVFRFRYQIYRIELSHHFLDEKHVHNDMLYEDSDFGDNTFIVYSGDIKNITGTVRITFWDNDKLPQKVRDKYLITDEMLKNFKIGEVHFLQVAPHYRRSLLSYALINNLLKICGDHPDIAADIYFGECQPGLLPYYLDMGLFVYSDHLLFKEHGILQIPLVIATCDLAWLKQQDCSSYYPAKRSLNHMKKIAPAIAKAKQEKNYQALIPHLSLYMTPEQKKQYREKMDEDLLKQFDFITSLLPDTILLSLKKDTILIKQDIVDYDFYLLVDGELGVFIKEVLVTKLTPGSFCGEMAFLNKKHKRYTDVTSLTDVKLIVIPRNLLSQLERKDLKSANKLLRMMCNTLSDKLIKSNEIFQTLSDKSNKKF